MGYINEVRIIKVLPCIAMPERIRFIAELDQDIDDLMPYLNAMLDDAIYNHEGHYIMLKKGDAMISITGRQFSASKVADLNDAQEIIKWFKELVDRCNENRNAIKPSFERRKRVTPLDLFKLLPGTNCKKCGQPTCLAFAVALADEKKSVIACSELFSGRFNEKRKELLRILKSAGYKVPSEFLDKDEK